MFQIQIVTVILVHCVKFGIKKCQKTRKNTFYVHFTLCFYICNLHNIKYFLRRLYIFLRSLFVSEIRQNLRNIKLRCIDGKIEGEEVKNNYSSPRVTKLNCMVGPLSAGIELLCDDLKKSHLFEEMYGGGGSTGDACMSCRRRGREEDKHAGGGRTFRPLGESRNCAGSQTKKNEIDKS